MNIFDDMTKGGSSLPKIVKELIENGWYIYQHHDNWRHKNFGETDFDTHGAYDQLNLGNHKI